jgi:cation/acetate symporter
LAAALVTARGPLNAIVQTFGRNAEARNAALGHLTPLVTAGLVLVAAALIAIARPGSMLTVATWAFTLAAAGLFPALVAGLWWRRANAYGAAAAGLAGLTVAVLYLVGTRYFAIPFFEALGSLSSAGPMARDTFGELNDAWTAAAPGAAKDAAWAALDAHARSITNLWGVTGLATVLLALPVAIVALIVGSLAGPGER